MANPAAPGAQKFFGNLLRFLTVFCSKFRIEGVVEKNNVINEAEKTMTAIVAKVRFSIGSKLCRKILTV